MSKCTPGEWILDAGEDMPEIDILDERGFPIATLPADPIINRWNERFPDMKHWAEGADDGRTCLERPREELLANGQLFVNAKDMLEQMQLALPLLEGLNAKCTQDTAFIKNFRATIARATGQAQAQGAPA